MARDQLIKLQVSKNHTYEVISQIFYLDKLDQAVVDPQNPKEQARIQEIKDDLEARRERMLELCSILGIAFEELPELKEENKFFLTSPQKLISKLDVFLGKYEEKIISQGKKLRSFKKEERILSALSSFQDEFEKSDFSIDLLTSSSGTFTFLGEIPSSYEELIRFYLHELTASEVFFWTSKTDSKETKIAICVSLLNYKNQIEEVLKENFFDSTKLDINLLESIEEEEKKTSVKELHTGMINDISSIENFIAQHKEELEMKIIDYISTIQALLEILTIEEKGRTTSEEFTYWGWIKDKFYSELVSALETTDTQYTIQILEEIPFKRKKTEEKVAITMKLSEEKRSVEKPVPHLSHRGLDSEGGLLFPKKASFIKLEASVDKKREFVAFLHSLNTVHPIKIGNLTGKRLEEITDHKQLLVQYQSDLKKIREDLNLEKKITSSQTVFEIVDDFKHTEAFVKNFLRDFQKPISELTSKLDNLKKKVEQIDLYLPFETELREKGIETSLLEEGLHTDIHLGSIPRIHLKAVRFFLNEVTDGNIMIWTSPSLDRKRNERNLLILSLKEYEQSVLRVLNEYSYQPIDFDINLLKQEKTSLETKNELKEQIKELEREKEAIKSQISEKLDATEELIDIELERTETLELTQIMDDKIVLWGWIPVEGLNKFQEEKEDLSFKIDFTLSDKVPLVNPSITKKGKLFSAIRGIVGGIGEPNPHEIDPYSIVRFTFPLLFGIMFADVGHGLMLAMIGAFFAIKKWRKNIEPDESITGYLYSGAELLVFCGLSATIFGFLFGSLLGDEYFLPEIYHNLGIHFLPLINPLHEVQLFLVVALTIGFIMLQFGIWLKVIENMKYGHGLASKLAPISLSIIYIGIFSLLYNIIGAGVESHTFHVALPAIPPAAFNVIIIITLVMLPVLFVLEFLHAKADGVMDAIDHVIALLSNTLSFSRIMALLLVHAILSALPFNLTGVPEGVSALNTAWWYWIVGIVMGLVVIVPIEGLLSFLNTLRLHWVEWFSKFYVGDGKKYNPLTQEFNHIKLVKAKGS